MPGRLCVITCREQVQQIAAFAKFSARARRVPVHAKLHAYERAIRMLRSASDRHRTGLNRPDGESIMNSDGDDCQRASRRVVLIGSALALGNLSQAIAQVKMTQSTARYQNTPKDNRRCDRCVQLPAAECVQIRRGQYPAERLVPAVCQENVDGYFVVGPACGRASSDIAPLEQHRLHVSGDQAPPG